MPVQIAAIALPGLNVSVYLNISALREIPLRAPNVIRLYAGANGHGVLRLLDPLRF